MEIQKVDAYIESLKKLNSFMAAVILQLQTEAAQFESSLESSRKSFGKSAQ